tara:strand:+ start:443 stop:688 length:246 start_codon:yes stop_codon:yes gene_type:complete
MIFSKFETIFLYLERKKIYQLKNYKKLSAIKKKEINFFIDFVRKDKKLSKEIRYVNLIIKFEKILNKKFYSNKQIKELLYD